MIACPLWVSVPDRYFVTDTNRSTGPVEKDALDLHVLENRWKS